MRGHKAAAQPTSVVLAHTIWRERGREERREGGEGGGGEKKGGREERKEEGGREEGKKGGREEIGYGIHRRDDGKG